jgi:hypothetical protein
MLNFELNSNYIAEFETTLKKICKFYNSRMNKNYCAENIIKIFEIYLNRIIYHDKKITMDNLCDLYDEVMKELLLVDDNRLLQISCNMVVEFAMFNYLLKLANIRSRWLSIDENVYKIQESDLILILNNGTEIGPIPVEEDLLLI